MELNENGFLEELVALSRETNSWDQTNIIPTEMNELFSNNTLWGFDNNCFDQNLASSSSSSSLPGSSAYCQELSPPFEQQNFNNNYYYSFNEVYCPFGQLTDSSYNTLDTPTFPIIEEDYPLSLMEEEELGILGDEIHELETQACCKTEPVQSPEAPVFKMGMSLERKNRAKKVQGQPSKNLMAERRRRKRLNDRLSMLRSIVPKISKMDRTSILGDTIDYMKELLERINYLQKEIDHQGSNQLDVMGLFKDIKPNEILVRNSPKFHVERSNVDTRIEICCSGKPGLLFSTVSTLEALGIEIEQCVISCFNDFAMQASCSERAVVSSEDIKEALFRNAGYGGRCL
ncbi:hypothetical protein FNV43_RR12633 [Rhamnella rubrinervis]|uniref:BHLH domain-containing protein n=1 Tax=Rhamnella rubrinervis TaxID=2594499 RepID=A0A8K0H7T7_9ROSA|nr:hypothetical protein FNV43_RR12633 [Rhamnella rubrinervis]